MADRVVLYVNVDVIFVFNFVMNLIWFWATGSLSGLRFRVWRLVAAAAAGAALAVWASFPSGRLIVTPPGMLIGSVLLLALGFWPLTWRQFVRLCWFFLFTAAIMAGMMLVMLLRREGGVIGLGRAGIPGLGKADLANAMAGMGALIALVGGRYLWAVTRARASLKPRLFRLRLEVEGRMWEADALVDTGNQLQAPLSGTPVIVVESRALAGFLPEVLLQAAADEEQRLAWGVLDLLPPGWKHRYRVLPFRSVGRSGGLLVGFAPDRIALRPQEGGEWTAVEAVVGLAAVALHVEGVYQALLPPGLVDGPPRSGQAIG